MTSLGFESKNGAIFQMLADLDADGNGNIDFDEWLILMTKRVNDKDTRANINKIYALFDSDKKGYINGDDLKRIASDLGENIEAAEIAELIARADVNTDGVVDEEEFYTIITRKIRS